jgi:hypothetical protein
MKSILGSMIVALAVAFAPPAQADAQVALDIKVGYAVPTGNIMESIFTGQQLTGPLSDLVSGSVPIEVAARYRFTPRLSAGAYFQYAPAFAASTICLASYTCSAYNMRVGAEVVYGFLPDRFLNPWLSLGTGWEWTNITVDTHDPAFGKFVGNVNGWEWFNVQAGLDFDLARSVAFGPYVGYFMGQYTSVGTDFQGVSRTEAIPSANRQAHGWWQFGVKGTLNL